MACGMKPRADTQEGRLGDVNFYPITKNQDAIRRLSHIKNIEVGRFKNVTEAERIIPFLLYWSTVGGGSHSRQAWRLNGTAQHSAVWTH